MDKDKVKELDRKYAKGEQWPEGEGEGEGVVLRRRWMANWYCQCDCAGRVTNVMEDDKLRVIQGQNHIAGDVLHLHEDAFVVVLNRPEFTTRIMIEEDMILLIIGHRRGSAPLDRLPCQLIIEGAVR